MENVWWTRGLSVVASALYGTHLGEGRRSTFSASQAFEQLVPMTKLHTPTTKALAANYIPLEGPICGLLMNSNCNHSEEDIFTHLHKTISS